MSLPKSEAVFAVRIVTCDHYTTTPLKDLDPSVSDFRQAVVKQVPVIRIFGSTPAGQKCCLHVHGCFPYFCIPSPVSTPSEEFLRQFAAAIDAGLNSAFAKNGLKSGPNERQKFERQYVHEILQFRGIPFYGYHNEEILFLKIYFYSPLVVKKAAEILQSGAIMNVQFQPHELHVPFELKFLIDHDLYGMDYIAVKNVKFRFSGIVDVRTKRHASPDPANLSQKVWIVGQLDEKFRLPANVQRMATCELEADCLASDIIKQNSGEESAVQNPGLRFIWKDEIDRRKTLRIDAVPSVTVSQDRPVLNKLPHELMQFETLGEILEQRQGRSDKDQSMADVEFDTSERAEGEVSFRNLSLASDHSAVGVFANLLDNADSDVRVVCDQNFALVDERSADESQETSDEDEDEDAAAREESEMSQKIEEFSDGDDDVEAETERIEQVDGPPGDGDDAVEVVDLSSDSSSECDLDIDRRRLGHVPESPQPSEEVENLISGSSDFGEIGDSETPQVEEPEMTLPGPSDGDINLSGRASGLSRNTTPTHPRIIPVLAPSLKLPSRKEMVEWLGDSKNKRLQKKIWSDANQHGDDIDVMDIEEIQARLSPDESIMLSDSMSVADAGNHAHRLVDTPVVMTKSAMSLRRGSKDTTILSKQEKLRSTPTTSRKSGRRLILSQPNNIPPHSDVTFASAHDIERLDQAHLSSDTTPKISERKKDRAAKKFRIRRRNKAERPLETPKPKMRKSMIRSKKKNKNVSELDAPTIVDSFGFNTTETNLAGAQITQGAPCLTVMAVEVHFRTRNDLRPDPEFDSVGAIFYAFHVDNATGQHLIKGVIVVCSTPEEKEQTMALKGFDRFHSKIVDSELAAFDTLVETVRNYDPDILVGYEIQLLSWGFLFDRAQFLGVDLCSMVSRIPDSPRQSRFSTRDDWWSMADIHVAGRIVLNLGRIMRHEVTLYIYSFENVVYNALRQRVPSYDFRTLTEWFNSSKTRWRVFDYYLYRVQADIELMNHCDILNRSSELARLYGIQFYEVLSRGSQFRVESMLLRMARARKFVALSPSVSQRNRMAAPECIALTMEPESRFYTDPVLVLDFQSLYPSVIIAYNYCYSTCLGRIRNYAKGDVIEVGCHKIKITTELIKNSLDNMTISPAGVAFVKSDIRWGIMPQMLEEILDTRVMVKQSAKLYKNDKSLQKVLDARQLGLKMIANVTYGYTAATFSGRMPCTEISDSIVQKGRETLTRAIDMVRNEKKWNARVVYGDTDSLFVLLPGRSKEEAFRIGQEIVDAVTADNPKPVKLKFEKVYYPCVLQTKKRYVGYAYESLDQKEPVFDAKGIETVRRDVCPAVAKILQKSLETLFISKDISTVRRYVTRQFQRIHHGRVSPLDFIFTRKYRGREHYKPDAAAPVLLITKRRLQKDRRSEPRIKERVPYVIVSGHPGATLISCVREPSEVIFQRGQRLNYKYYITKQICAALNRVFNIVGVDTLEWYRSMPRVDRSLYGFGLRGQHNGNHAGMPTVLTISQYFHVTECAVCRNVTTRDSLCTECAANPQTSVLELQDRVRCLERRRDFAYQLCNQCMMWRPTTGGCQPVDCTSVVCPITYKRVELDYDIEQALQLRRLLQNF